MENKIVDTATKLFLKFGFKSVSMDDISQELGISKKTLYNYFDNKQSLVVDSMNCVVDKINHSIQRVRNKNLNPIDEIFAIRNELKEVTAIEEASACVFQLRKYYPEVFSLFQKKQIARTQEKIKENIERGIQEGIYRKEIDPFLYSCFYYMGIINLTDEDFFEKYDHLYLKDEYLFFFLHSICNKKGLEILNQHIQNND